jgi:coproporphyrinogen III oxidase-like Fe-S oxidoreductase
MRGLNLDWYRSQFGRDLRDEYRTELSRLEEAGLIDLSDNLIKLTRHGTLLSNEVFSTFV